MRLCEIAHVQWHRCELSGTARYLILHRLAHTGSPGKEAVKMGVCLSLTTTQRTATVTAPGKDLVSFAGRELLELQRRLYSKSNCTAEKPHPQLDENSHQKLQISILPSQPEFM